MDSAHVLRNDKGLPATIFRHGDVVEVVRGGGGDNLAMDGEPRKTNRSIKLTQLKYP
jgi:hypothetical protein